MAEDLHSGDIETNDSESTILGRSRVTSYLYGAFELP